MEEQGKQKQNIQTESGKGGVDHKSNRRNVKFKKGK